MLLPIVINILSDLPVEMCSAGVFEFLQLLRQWYADKWNCLLHIIFNNIGKFSSIMWEVRIWRGLSASPCSLVFRRRVTVPLYYLLIYLFVDMSVICYYTLALGRYLKYVCEICGCLGLPWCRCEKLHNNLVRWIGVQCTDSSLEARVVWFS
jgi:hypothetical protein